MLNARRAGLHAALVIVAVLGSARSALACSCMESAAPCRAFWSTPVVFDGVVRSVDSQGMATFDVRHVWKGNVPAGIAIPSGNGASCRSVFRAGRRYLVFAVKNPRDGELDTSCSATREWDGSGRDVEFLASLSKPATGGRIFGTVEHQTTFGGGLAQPAVVPVATSVRLISPTGQRTVVSTGGEFDFSGLANGTYRVHIDVPRGFTGDNESSVTIAHARDCSSETFVLDSNGRIAGRMVPGAGNSFPQRVRVMVARAFPDFATPDPLFAAIRPDGSFEVDSLPPGDYVIGVNLKNTPVLGPEPNSWMPDTWLAYASGNGTPRVFTINAGERIDLGTWTLPAPARTVAASGFVTWEDGTPAVGVVLRLFENTRRTESLYLPAEVVTESDGHFSLPLLADRTYRFTARYKGKDATMVMAPALAIGAQPPAPLRIVVRRSK